MIKIGDKEYRNLEEQVAFLTQKSTLANLGLHLNGFVGDTSELPMENVVDGDTYGVGTQPPYRYYAYNGGAYSDIGTFPQEGPRGIQGDQGPEGKQGPRGEKGPAGPQGIAGPAGKNGNGIGVDKITDINLAAGESSIVYNNTNGGTITKQGRIIAAGQNYSIQVDDKLPIIPGKNVSIKPNTANTALEINAEQEVQSVNGKKGAVVLKTSDLQNDSGFITSAYHDPKKQNTLVSGDNIKTINNESILGPGNITISGGGGGGGTDTGFDNVSRIEAADNQTTYNPDTKEYIISSGNADIFYKDGTKTTIPYVQEIGLMAGDNITFTEEFVDNANYRVKINATGGGSASDGFNNLKELILTPSTYINNTPAGDFYFEGNGTFKLKDSSPATGIESIKIQLPVVPGDGIIFDKDTGNSCVIKAADYKPTITLETYTASQNTSHYGRVYYTFDVGDSTVATDIANGKYNVTIYDQTSGGGYYYCPLQGDTMTFLGEEVPNDNNGGKPSSIVGWSFKAKESETVVSFWRDSLSLNGGGGGGSASLYQHTITMQGSQYKYKITVVNPYQGSITGSSIWKEIYGTNRFTASAIVTDSMDRTVSISSVYVYITPTNGLSILFFPSNGSSQHSEAISSSSTWEDNIISF